MSSNIIIITDEPLSAVIKLIEQIDREIIRVDSYPQEAPLTDQKLSTPQSHKYRIEGSKVKNCKVCKLSFLAKPKNRSLCETCKRELTKRNYAKIGGVDKLPDSPEELGFIDLDRSGSI